MQLQKLDPIDYSLNRNPKYSILPDGAPAHMGSAGDEENIHPNRDSLKLKIKINKPTGKLEAMEGGSKGSGGGGGGGKMSSKGGPRKMSEGGVPPADPEGVIQAAMRFPGFYPRLKECLAVLEESKSRGCHFGHALCLLVCLTPTRWLPVLVMQWMMTTTRWLTSRGGPASLFASCSRKAETR